ncbi:MAG: ATP-binding cassette domain-containing protein, partial [Anaerolineales bacterium]|nr:ATP-binding cassette domain-containing protein [Anaerolineales bacterium]
MAGIRFQSIRKTFGKTIAANDVSLEIKDGEFMVLLGPSGCGKTTLLRCLAGLEHVDAGRVFIGDRDVNLWYGDFQALRDVAVNIKPRMITSLIGPSGCGKTTLLNIVAGLEQADSG